MARSIYEFTITEDTDRRITIELEEGQAGAYRIMRDDMVSQKSTFDYNDAD